MVSPPRRHTPSFHPITNLLSDHGQKRKRLPTVPLNRPCPHFPVVKGCERSTQVAADRTHPRDKLPSSMSVVLEDASRRNTSFKKGNVGKERSTKEETHKGSSFYEEGPLSSQSTNGEPLQGQDHGKTSHAFCSPFAISCRATYQQPLSNSSDVGEERRVSAPHWIHRSLRYICPKDEACVQHGYLYQSIFLVRIRKSSVVHTLHV